MMPNYKAKDEKSQAVGDSHTCQCLITDVPADDDRINHAVYLLEHVPQYYWKCKQQYNMGRTPLC